jgi:hypothetical protein
MILTAEADQDVLDSIIMPLVESTSDAAMKPSRSISGVMWRALEFDMVSPVDQIFREIFHA